MNHPEPEVTLLTWTQDPLETVYSVWDMSKSEGPLMSTAKVKEKVSSEEVEKLFRAVIAQRIPIGEHVHFVFQISNVSVSWREQAVRHRIGVNPSPERLGADIVMMDKIPDLASSSWWSQSMRIQNMGKFAQRKQYRLPKSVLEHPDDAVLGCFQSTMKAVEDGYNFLVESGIPMEDARELIGLGAHHRISWDLNIGSLQHIVGKRGCWILQLGIWGPVIIGMINELAEKVHPIFRELVTPPCMKGNDFTGCVFMEECRRRHTGDDALPPCPLHLNYHHVPEVNRGMLPLQLSNIEMPRKDEMVKRAEDYRTFWGRDPYTGEISK